MSHIVASGMTRRRRIVKLDGTNHRKVKGYKKRKQRSNDNNTLYKSGAVVATIVGGTLIASKVWDSNETGLTSREEYKEDDPRLLKLEGEDLNMFMNIFSFHGYEKVQVRRIITWWSEANADQRNAWIKSAADYVGGYDAHMLRKDKKLKHKTWNELERNQKQYLIEYQLTEKVKSDTMQQDAADGTEINALKSQRDKNNAFKSDQEAVDKLVFKNYGIHVKDEAVIGKKPEATNEEKPVECPLCFYHVPQNAMVIATHKECNEKNMVCCFPCIGRVNLSMNKEEKEKYQCPICLQKADDTQVMVRASGYLFAKEKENRKEELEKLLPFELFKKKEKNKEIYFYYCKTKESMLQVLIEEEDKNKPYTDEQLISELKKKGYDNVQTSDIKKYRESLSIHAHEKRKERYINSALRGLLRKEAKDTPYNPYTDVQLLNELWGQGYTSLIESDIADYRKRLSIHTHEKRKKRYTMSAVKEILKNEDKNKPYTDEQLLSELKKKGYDNIETSDIANYRK